MPWGFAVNAITYCFTRPLQKLYSRITHFRLRSSQQSLQDFTSTKPLHPSTTTHVFAIMDQNQKNEALAQFLGVTGAKPSEVHSIHFHDNFICARIFDQAIGRDIPRQYRLGPQQRRFNVLRRPRRRGRIRGGGASRRARVHRTTHTRWSRSTGIPGCSFSCVQFAPSTTTRRHCDLELDWPGKLACGTWAR